MADVWPIETIWCVIYEKLRGKVFKSTKALKQEVNEIWKSINNNKNLCRCLMSSIPRRMEAIITKQGEQICRSDY